MHKPSSAPSRAEPKAAPDKIGICELCHWPLDDPAHYAFHAMRVADQDYLRTSPKRLEAMKQASTQAEKVALAAEDEEAYRTHLVDAPRPSGPPLS